MSPSVKQRHIATDGKIGGADDLQSTMQCLLSWYFSHEYGDVAGDILYPLQDVLSSVRKVLLESCTRSLYEGGRGRKQGRL